MDDSPVLVLAQEQDHPHRKRHKEVLGLGRCNLLSYILNRRLLVEDEAREVVAVGLGFKASETHAAAAYQKALGGIFWVSWIQKLAAGRWTWNVYTMDPKST